MYISSQINQYQPNYLRLGTYGDRLWDEKGWLDASGASNGASTTDMGMPTQIVGQGSSNNQQPNNTSNDPSKMGDGSGIPTTVTSATDTANKPTDVKDSDDLIFGMTKKQLALGLGVGIIGGLLLFYGYKKFK